MKISNTVPSNESSQLVKTFKFPFQLGVSGLPAMEDAVDYAYANIKQLFMTGTGERVMNPSIGLDLEEFCFRNMTPIDKVRVASKATAAIETFLPWIIVKSIIPSQTMYEDGVGSSIVFDVKYAVGGQAASQQIEVTPGIKQG